MQAHILVVEDDNNLRVMIAHILRRAGYEIAQAANGERAIEMLTQGGQQPAYDLVLTDIVMGTVNGIEVMDVARSQSNPPEVILITGHGSLETAMEAVRHGAFDYILKPCPKDILLERVASCVEHRKNRLTQATRAEKFSMITGLTQNLCQVAKFVPLQ